MAKKKKKTTKAPGGTSISRSANKFTCKWKIVGGDYGDGQQFQYRLKVNGKWGAWTPKTPKKLGAKVTSRVVKINPDSYYPTTGKTAKLGAVEFRIRGNKKDTDKINYTMSGWSYYTYDVLVPKKPAAKEPELSSEVINQCNFPWETENKPTAKEYFRNVEWEAIRVMNSVDTPASAEWTKTDNDHKPVDGTGTGSASDNQDIEEDSSVVNAQNKNSYTRWFRVRSRGPQGASKWAYSKHVYAIPYQAVIKETYMEKTPEGGTQCFVRWTSDTGGGTHPIDRTLVEYKIATPEEGMVCPSGSWSPGAPSNDVLDDAAVAFTIDDQIGEDECLFVRVNNEHDVNEEYGITRGLPTIPRGGVGPLASPVIDSLQVNPSQHKATIGVENRSNVPDSRLAVYFRLPSDPSAVIIVGVTTTHDQDEIIVTCPAWGDESPEFGLKAFVGTATYDAATNSYAIPNPVMESITVWEGGAVPLSPTNVVGTPLIEDGIGTILVRWDWTWPEADGAIISWSDHKDAWQSTDEPETYEISHMHASQWNISGLEPGKTWYVRVRLIKGSGDNRAYGPWSEIDDQSTVNLKSAPTTPTLQLSKATITEDESVEASWAYSSGDGTGQAQADICLATITQEGIVYSDPIIKVGSAQHVTIDAKKLGFTNGNIYNLCVRVISASGEKSDTWSSPAPLTVAAKPTITATLGRGFAERTFIDDYNDEDQPITHTAMSIVELPLSVSIAGAGYGGSVSLQIIRQGDYHMIRPDDSTDDGFDKENIAVVSDLGDRTLDIARKNLVGSLDDGATYTVIARVTDPYGQVAEQRFEDIEVHWDRQALIPDAQIEMDGTMARITPIAPSGWQDGDTCDIYRLSADKPELIYPDAEFGVTYVDPYPAIGEHGGHRIVYKTVNGDYIHSEITEEPETGYLIEEGDEPAWINTDEKYGDRLDLTSSLIDFDGYQIALNYNVDIGNQWQKDFAETRYLGGAVRGDWNKAIGRSASIGAVMINLTDEESIMDMRRLAVHAGECHLRTPDGSSFSCDLQVSEDRSHDRYGMVTSFTISGTRVDGEGYDGLPLEELSDELE